MVFIGEKIRDIGTGISRGIREKFTGDSTRYWNTDLSREDIDLKIHIGDSIRRREGDQNLHKVTRTDSINGIVYIEEGYFEANDLVIIGCPGGKGH